MSRRPDINLLGLDALIDAVGFPVRPETIEHAWELTGQEDGGPSEITIVVTLVAKPDLERELEQAAREFVEATRRLPGTLGSTLHRSTEDPRTFTLIERFTGADVIDRHMASDYFRRFQLAQGPLLAQPVR